MQSVQPTPATRSDGSKKNHPLSFQLSPHLFPQQVAALLASLQPRQAGGDGGAAAPRGSSRLPWGGAALPRSARRRATSHNPAAAKTKKMGKRRRSELGELGKKKKKKRKIKAKKAKAKRGKTIAGDDDEAFSAEFARNFK